VSTDGLCSLMRTTNKRRGDERGKGYGAVECGGGVGAFYRAIGEGVEAVGAGARSMTISGAISSRGGNGEGKRGVGEMKGAVAPFHFSTGEGRGCCTGEGEQATAVAN
jgi:hypothetical protein